MCCFRPRGCAAHTNVRGDETLRLCSVCTVTHGMRLQRGFSDCGNFSGDFSLVAPCCCLLTLVYPTIYCRLWHKIWNLVADPCCFSLHKKKLVACIPADPSPFTSSAGHRSNDVNLSVCKMSSASAQRRHDDPAGSRSNASPRKHLLGPECLDVACAHHKGRHQHH